MGLDMLVTINDVARKLQAKLSTGLVHDAPVCRAERCCRAGKPGGPRQVCPPGKAGDYPAGAGTGSEACPAG